MDDLYTLNNCLVVEICLENEKCSSSSAGYKQLINKPTHIVSNSSSCINLMFCNNQNLIFDWKKAFENLSVDKKVNFLNGTLVNIFQNYITNKKSNLIIVNCHG